MIDDLYSKMEALFDERDWAQFHSPKNLAMDLASEVGELIEHFRWVTEEKSYEESGIEVEEEIGDVFIAITHLAKKLGIDPVKAAEKKLQKIAKRYPADQAKGKCLKYTAYY